MTPARPTPETSTTSEPQHGIWEQVFLVGPSRRPYGPDGRYTTQCKCCHDEKPNHRPDCDVAALQRRVAALEKCHAADNMLKLMFANKAAEREKKWLIDHFAMEAWRSEVVEPDMVSLTVGPRGDYANKQEWLEDWVASLESELCAALVAAGEEIP